MCLKVEAVAFDVQVVLHLPYRSTLRELVSAVVVVVVRTLRDVVVAGIL